MFPFLRSFLPGQLEQWDRWLFRTINTDSSNAVFDAIMPFVRNGANWAPLYLFLGVFVVINFKTSGWWWILFFVITVALTDMTGTYLFKHNFHRDRPCMNPEIAYQVKLLIKQCSGSSSFTSNHAANHFGMAAYLFVTMRSILRRWAWAGFAWAAVIAYAQVYVGIHYPIDVLAGALIGILIGVATGKMFDNRYGFTIFDNQPTISS